MAIAPSRQRLECGGFSAALVRAQVFAGLWLVNLP